MRLEYLEPPLLLALKCLLVGGKLFLHCLPIASSTRKRLPRPRAHWTRGGEKLRIGRTPTVPSFQPGSRERPPARGVSGSCGPKRRAGVGGSASFMFWRGGKSPSRSAELASDRTLLDHSHVLKT